MTILDRYIIRSFVFNYVLWFFCIVGIFIVFDLFTSLDSMVKMAKESGHFVRFMLTAYVFKSVPIAMMLSSVLGLISAMITIAIMIRNNELIPIQAAGISTIRIVTPLIGSVFVVIIATTIIREMVLPHYLDELVMSTGDYVKERGKMVNAAIDNETGITIQGDRVFQVDSRISNPNFVLHRPVVKQMTYLKAKNAFYRPAQNDRPAGFMLSGMNELPEVVREGALKYNDKTIILTAREAPDWIESNECFVVTDIPFDYLASNDAWRQYTSTWEMIQACRNRSLDVGNQVRAGIHGRLLLPFLDMTLLFLGLPIILGNGDRNIFKAMGISGLFIVAFLIVRESCQYLGANFDMPVLGAWLPLMIFTPIAISQFLGLREK